jgi:hypothetical protein
MQKQTINQNDAEKVFVIGKNISGATLSQYAAVFADATSAAAGEIGISGAVTGKKHLFLGSLQTSLANGATGLVQVYGPTSIYMVLSDTGASAVPGDQLIAVTSQTYLVDFSGTSLVPTAGENYATLLGYYSAAAEGNSAPLAKAAFIRAM